jgi:hypothetical protein
MADPSLKDLYDQMTHSITEIDEKLDSLGDPKTAGKSKIIKEAIEKTKDTWSTIVDTLKTQLSTAPADVQVGVYYGISRGLSDAFSDSTKATVEKIVESQPKVEPMITEEEAKKLQPIRSELYQKLKTLVDMATNFGMADGMELPKKRTGAKGKRGPRAASFITWSIDGVEVEGAKGTLKPVVELYDQYEKVGELTEAMRESGVNLTEPDKEGNKLEFTLPDGKLLTGEYDPPESDDEVEEDNSETESE